IVATWIPSLGLQLRNGRIGAFQVPWGFRLDPLAEMMILVVTGIGFLIHVYSIAYMHDEPRGGYARFFCYLNLFCFFMLMLVLGSTFLTMFVGWEGVGLCSYLLIGYWYEKKSASDAGMKAFIVNRVGDWGFVLGVFLIYYTFGTLDFRAVANAAAALPVESTQFGVLSLICLLLFVGATGKSAQIPLYVWLPDVKRNLRALAGSADKQQQADQRQHAELRRLDRKRRRRVRDGAEVERAEGVVNEEHAKDKSPVAHPVDDERFHAGVGRTLFLVPVADQQIRAQAHAFPTDEHRQERAAEHEHEHEEAEEIQVAEKPRVAAAR